MNANVEAKAVVIGGGITGLCAAYYLSRELGREQVLLLEASDYLGGHVRTDHINGFSCDWGPNGFLDREPTTLEWIRDLGLSDRMVKANEAAARRFIYRDGKLHEIKPPPAFLASPILSMRGRARLLCEPLLPPKQNDAPESIYDFAARRIGREAADMLVSPMVSGIFGGDAKRLSLEHCFPRMRAMEAEHGSLFKALMAKRKENKKASAMGPGGVLTSFDQGASLLPETASSALGNRAIRNCGAISVVREGDKFIIRGANGIEVRSQFLIIATPAFATADIVCGWDEALAKSLRTIT